MRDQRQLSSVSIRLLLFAGLVGLTTGCTVGPEVKTPDSVATTTAAFVNAPAATPATTIMDPWWDEIGDPLFEEQVQALLRDNLSLQQSAERVIQAEERLAIQRGGRRPAVGYNAGVREGFTEINSSGDRVSTSSYNADLNVTWALDLFGKLKRANESAEASFQASQADEEALQHVLIAELLNRRVAVAVNAKLLEWARENSANRESLYRLVKRRYDLGARGSALTDVYLAENNFAAVQGDIAEFERKLSEELYRLDTLLGLTPGTTDPTETPFPVLAPPLQLPELIPAELLDRRPDLRASELRARAATANVGVAIADLYPEVNLTGTLGVSSNSADDLFSADQVAGSILGSVTGKLFAGGSLQANVRLKESAARELAIRYAGDVLEALREVESALKADRELAIQIEAFERSVTALRHAERLSETRYRNGIQTLQGFLDTQQRRYLSEQAWLRGQQARWATRISLYLALGGDWNSYLPDRPIVAAAPSPSIRHD